jgi:hypothetical protein
VKSSSKIPLFFVFWASFLIFTGCASQAPEIRRLSPLSKPTQPPASCHIVSVIKDSPAEKVGIQVGEVLKSVNGQVPQDASVLPDIITAAPDDSDVEITQKDGSSRHVRVHLNKSRPRLGTVCDLTGWEKPGVTAAGNESVTVFHGPYAMTASGIIDKGIMFLRVRVSNNTDKPLEVSPKIFSAFDGGSASLPLLSPKDVMCYLYGDKGAHLLTLKKKHKETMDGYTLLTPEATTSEDRCDISVTGKLATSDSQYAEANAQYVASESLWPATYQMGTVADGLIYLKEPKTLPVTLKAAVDRRSLFVKLGQAQGVDKEIKPSELIQFFRTQKKGTPLRLTLKKGKVFVGKFSSYDTLEERAWFDTPSGGMLNSTSYSISNIRYAEPLDQIPSKTAPSSNDLN